MQFDATKDYHKQSVSNGRNFAYAIAHNRQDCHNQANIYRLTGHIERLKNDMRKSEIALRKLYPLRNAILTQKGHMNNVRQANELRLINIHVKRLEDKQKKLNDLIQKSQYKLAHFINGKLYQPIKQEKKAFNAKGKIQLQDVDTIQLAKSANLIPVDNTVEYRVDYTDLTSCKHKANQLAAKHNKAFVVYKYSTEEYTRDTYDIVSLEEFDKYDIAFKSRCYVIYQTN